MRQHLAEAMSNLSQKEKQILSLRYFQQLKMQTIASVLHVTSSRVSQIHSAALAKLRAQLEAKESSDATKQRIASMPGSD
jgi:RNA polymerase sigma factor for flagellar operon FliA